MHVDASASPATVTGAIRQAARMTGADFQYLVATAQVESNFRPNARAATSSARGLFQFVEQTWLQTLKHQGAALGYGRYADAIARLPSGKYVVTEPGLRGPIMNMRSDPTTSAVMAGAFTRANAARLEGRLGRAPDEGELYIAHFLGAAGAGRLIGLAESRPAASAAAVFPGAAKANRSIFYDRQGHARSTSEVYRALVNRYEVARAGRTAPAVLAMDAPRPPADLGPPKVADTYQTATTSPSNAATRSPARRPAVALDPAASAGTYPVTARGTPPVARANEDGRIFHGLFRTAGAREPVAAAVSALWTTPAQAPPPANTSRGSTEPAASTHDLFQESRPDVRALFRGRV